ncbi:MAG: hypothetical protein PHX61_02370 [Alphaproteobacteria bacterium]|nr:hypothetical protein [Alphaproteobacteria bacterium]
MTEAHEALGIPTHGLKECLTDLNVLCSGVTGTKCPRCESTDLGKLGYSSYKGVKRPRRVCRDCGYTFTIQSIDALITWNRAARILNLDDKKPVKIFEDTLAFGLIKKIGEDKYTGTALGTRLKSGNATKREIYDSIPVYQHLFETVGFELKRSKFENALKSYSDGSLSKIKRDTLWRRYQEIAVEIFVCEKTCQFSRTCKKDHHARKECGVVKKVLKPKRVWKAEIEI